MSTVEGQHVGVIGDALVEDEARSVERARQVALMKAIRPTDRGIQRGGQGAGDGDLCPDGHGRMYVFGQRQWCAAHAHDLAGTAWHPLNV